LDNRSLGQYCLFVAIVTVPTAILTYLAGDLRFGTIWLMWGALWFIFFLFMGLRKQIAKFTAYATLIVAVITGVVGYLLLVQAW